MQTIGKRYLLHERLGTGGMGPVYRATDRLTRNIVALKRVTAAPEDLTFASKAAGSTNLRLALATEFRTLSSLRHPHIISVLDYGFDEARQPYFTMEYLAGSDTITAAGQYVSVHAKVGLIIQMLQALVYLHRRGVIHRDLKPGNVLVMSGQVKVVDFGLSVTATTPSGKHRTESTAGTFAYMAPELFEGAPVSQSADLYAVGVMAYELFAGRHPFKVENIALLVNEILNKPADVWSIGLDDDLAEVLERLLVKGAEQR
jgi:serine/threonine protein kinase